MSGRTLIFILLIMLSSCSVSRRAGEKADTSGYSSLNLIERTEAGNMTKKNFNISKAEIEIINNGKKQKLLASLKYRNPGIYLLSIKSRAGIEAARGYITEDTVLINDRIYKKLYCGSTDYLSNKYGISTAALPLMTGDFLFNDTTYSKSINCKNGEAKLEANLKNNKVLYSLDCKRAKVTEASIVNEEESGVIRMNFSEFKESNGLIFPGAIEIEDYSIQNQLKIHISVIEFNITDNVEFIPGKNYERIVIK